MATTRGIAGTRVDLGVARVDEMQALDLDLRASLSEAGRVFVEGLPPGARWLEAERRLYFVPDFTQGGQRWTVVFHAGDHQLGLVVDVTDTIAPPAPEIVETHDQGDHLRLLVRQRTDAFLDSPGHAGRTFEARVVVPKAANVANRLPVQIGLHGFFGSPAEGGDGEHFRIYPHDPSNTYWWGYASSLPEGAPAQSVPPYTQRRVLHLMDWLLERYSGADPSAVYLTGGSMGGAGAKTLGLLHARHFAYVRAGIGQAIPRGHRPSRLEQLSGLWGAPEDALPASEGADDGAPSVWDHMDLTRVLSEHPEARDQFLYLKHGKDDGIIHFGAVVGPSPLTRLSFYQALQSQGVGHYAIWDEGGHGSPDPILGGAWADSGWNRITDPETFLRRDLPFAAFSKSSADQDPGTLAGNGRAEWDPESGFAASVEVPGDTGWDGDLAGALNRFLRWRTTTIVDSHDRFEIDLKVLDAAGEAAPAAGYPSRGDLFDRALPVRVDVTPRRVQRFQCLPNEPIRWRFAGLEGTVMADDFGALRVPGLPLETRWQRLILTRQP